MIMFRVQFEREEWISEFVPRHPARPWENAAVPRLLLHRLLTAQAMAVDWFPWSPETPRDK